LEKVKKKKKTQKKKKEKAGPIEKKSP